jgi:purine nucleoside permease
MRIQALCVSFLFASLAAFARAQTPVQPWPIRAVVIVTSEVGKDTGDTPGEYQFWVEREHLDEILDFPGGPNVPEGQHPLRTNKDHTVLGMLSGETLANATASTMLLGLDPRFDLSHAYILINGLAGVDPNWGSIGSAAWARYVVSDVAREIDSREIPKEWPYGWLPIWAREPNQRRNTPSPDGLSDLYPLNEKLATWAYEQTKEINLGDDDQLKAFRAEYTGYPNAQKPPFVGLGDTLASDVFWHGKVMTQFAEDWVRLWTGDKGVFAMTDMEDAGFMAAIERLGRMHRVDPQRVMVLRTGANYSMQRPGDDAVQSLTGSYSGGRIALESAWLCGSTVLHKILADWPNTYEHIPEAASSIAEAAPSNGRPEYSSARHWPAVKKRDLWFGLFGLGAGMLLGSVLSLWISRRHQADRAKAA